MNRPEQDQAGIDAEARDWIVRRSDGALSPIEVAAFEAWQARDPRHARTYAALAQTWEDAATLRHLAVLAPIPPLPGRKAERVGHGGSIIRWALPTALVATAVLALLVVRMPDLSTPTVPSQLPAIAEIRTETLPDGSTVTLGPKSEIAVRFSASERRVALLSGEAFFEVTHNQAEPFFVEAGDTTIRVVGTTFDVNRAPGSVRVSVQEGIVEIHEPEGSGALARKTVHMLKAGQRLEAIERDAAEGPQMAAVILPPTRTTAPGAWRQGWLVYENARLADLMADVNRYYAPGVRLSPEANDLRVTASFRTTDILSFLDTLGAALPVIVARDDDGEFRVSAKPDQGRPGRSGHALGLPK